MVIQVWVKLVQEQVTMAPLERLLVEAMEEEDSMGAITSPTTTVLDQVVGAMQLD